MESVSLLQALGVGSISGLVVSICVLFFARAYFGSYLNEKGKNLATKEDVANITKLVEEVKYRFSTNLEDHRTKNQLRMAALDRRLEAHQEAFTLWRQLLFSMHTEYLSGNVQRCQSWWNMNCLYLEPEAREAFVTAYSNASRHASYVRSGDTVVAKDNFDGIRKAGDIILGAAKLPGLTSKEQAEVDRVTAEQGGQ